MPHKRAEMGRHCIAPPFGYGDTVGNRRFSVTHRKQTLYNERHKAQGAQSNVLKSNPSAPDCVH